MKTFIAQICVKHTRVGISDIYEVKAPNEYHASDIVEELSGIKINGVTNYCEVIPA